MQLENLMEVLTSFHLRVGRMVACISTLTKRASEYLLCLWKLWCGRRDLNSRTIDLMVSRVVGLEAHWTSLCYVLDQARLRPHGPPRLPLGSSILRFSS